MKTAGRALARPPGRSNDSSGHDGSPSTYGWSGTAPYWIDGVEALFAFTPASDTV